MRKKLVLSIIFLVFFTSMIISFLAIRYTTLNKKNIEKEITTLKRKIEKNNKDSEKDKEEINNLKEESKDKLEELKIWEKAKEKLSI